MVQILSFVLLSTGGGSYFSSILKTLAILLLVCPMHVHLRGAPWTCVGSCTELEDFLLQLSPLQYFPHIFQPTGPYFPVPLARKMMLQSLSCKCKQWGIAPCGGPCSGQCYERTGKEKLQELILTWFASPGVNSLLQSACTYLL